MGTYVDFIGLIPQNMVLAQEFINNLKRFTPDELSLWFGNKGFNVGRDECGFILENSRSKHREAPIMWAY